MHDEYTDRDIAEWILDELVESSFFDVMPPLDETECEELDQ